MGTVDILPPLPPSCFKPDPYTVNEDGITTTFTTKRAARKYREQHGIPPYPFDQMPRYIQALDDWKKLR